MLYLAGVVSAQFQVIGLVNTATAVWSAAQHQDGSTVMQGRFSFGW